METAVQAVKRWNQVRAKLRKQAVMGTAPIKLRLARRILPGPDWPLHYLCQHPDGKRRTWNTRLAPLELSIADAVALAPRMKFIAEEVFCLPVQINGVQTEHGLQGNRELVWGGKGVVRVMRTGDLLYSELLACLRNQDLPNLWFLHS